MTATKRSTNLMRALALALAAWAVATFAWAVSQRLFYPFDLEWMEGGVLCQALRLAEGKPIYPPPSVDFIPFLYPPLYPALIAALGRVTPIGYLSARLLSLTSFLISLGAGFTLARRVGGSSLAAAAALALPVAAWVTTGSFYDLARPDSLCLALSALAVLIGWERRSIAGGAMAGVLMALAGLAKQTAGPVALALALALLIRDRRSGIAYALSLAIAFSATALALNHASHGWFITYVFQLHQRHSFSLARALGGAPGLIAITIGPAALLIPWALLRARSAGTLFVASIAAAGVVASALGYATQWAFENALIPGVFFIAVAAGASAGRLLDNGGNRDRRSTIVWGLLAAALTIAPGGITWIAERTLPASWNLRPPPTGYLPAQLIPTDADRAAGEHLIARLTAVEGEVFIPFHPFYAHLAGKQTFVHDMAMRDVEKAGLGPPPGLAEALAQARFALVVLDESADFWPTLAKRYRVLTTLDGPTTFSGTRFSPKLLLVPRSP